MVQANSASGMHVDDECKLKFLELKAKRNFRFIVFKIEEKKMEVVIEKLGLPDDSYDDFAASMPANECRYAVYDFDFTTDENCQKSKIFFIAWYNLFIHSSTYIHIYLKILKEPRSKFYNHGSNYWY